MPFDIGLLKKIMRRIAIMRPSYFDASIPIKRVRVFIYFVLMCS